MTNATYQTTVSADLPDNPLTNVLFTLETELATANEEIFPWRLAYEMSLDASGRGEIQLPTPDNTGVAAWAWNVRLPTSGPYLINLPYSAAVQELADLLDDVALSLPAAAALLSTKANVVPGAAGNLPQLLGNGHLEDSGITADALSALLFPEACYCAMNVAVSIPPNLRVLMPLQVVGQTAAIHPGGIAGTLTIQTRGLYDFQADVYTSQISLAGYYVSAEVRKNEETTNLLVGQNRHDGLATASVAQVLPVHAISVQMNIGDTLELYLFHNYTAPITFYVERLVVVRRGDSQ